MFNVLLLILVILLPGVHAKDRHKQLTQRQTAFKRAKSLNNGISISWLEQTWNADIFTVNPVKNTDFVLLKKLGFKSIRLPVAFAYFNGNYALLNTLFTRIDTVIKQCHRHGFKLIIDYHSGKLNDSNYLTETSEIINTWIAVCRRYKQENPDELLFELYNEPPHMNPQVWKDAAYNIVTAIRKADANRTLIIGASNFNSIYELSRMERLADENIIYTFHFYEPFIFTHQGAGWIGSQVATTGIPFPYNAATYPPLNPKTKGTWGETNYYRYPVDGNEQSVNDKLRIVKTWADKYNVPVLCGEYGVYNKYADFNSRCHYIKVVRKNLMLLGIPGMLWDYNSGFSIFNGMPSLNNLPDDMKEAIGYRSSKQ